MRAPRAKRSRYATTLTNLLAMIKKVAPSPRQEQQLDLLHRNMLPELQRMVKRVKIYSVDSLLTKSINAELTGVKRAYQLPPPPDQTFIPWDAYDPRKSPKKVEPQTQASGVEVMATPPESVDLRNFMSQLLVGMRKLNDRSFAESAKQSNGAPKSPQPGQKRNGQSQKRKAAWHNEAKSADAKPHRWLNHLWVIRVGLTKY